MSPSLFDPDRILFKMRTTKRWWIPILIAVIVAVNVLGLLRPTKYTSSALVLIHPPPISNVSIQQTFNLGDTLDTLNKRITSPSFLAEIARKLNLDAGIDTQSAQYDSLLNSMRDAIDLRKTPDYFEVGFTWFTPRETYAVTNEIVNLIITQSSSFYTEKARKSVTLWQTQLTQATLQMQQAQETIKEYKKNNPDQIPEAKVVQLERLGKARNDYETDLQEIARLKNYVQEAKLQLVNVPETISEISRADTSSLQMLQQQRAQTKMRLDALLQTFTDDHWEVRSARTTLAGLDDQLSSATAMVVSEVRTQPNPKYIEMSTRLLNYQMQLSSLQSGLQSKVDVINGIENYLKSNPTHENELLTLQREYNTQASQVEWLRARLNEAQQASYVDAKGGGPSFDVQSRPRVPTSPSSPNRVKIGLAAIFLGACAAGCVVLLFVFLDRTIRTIDEARNLLQMPMLGTVQKIVTPAQKAGEKRRRLIMAVGTAMILIILGGAGYAAVTFYNEEVMFNLGRVRDFMKQM